jgi:hypothetical protein
MDLTNSKIWPTQAFKKGYYIISFQSLGEGHDRYYVEHLGNSTKGLRNCNPKSSQTVGSLLIPVAGRASQENNQSIALMDLRNSKIWLTWGFNKGYYIFSSQSLGEGHDGYYVEHLGNSTKGVRSWNPKSSQTVGSLLIPVAGRASRKIDESIASMDLTNSKI